MTVPLETLKDHLAYTAWATNRLLDAATQLSDEELIHDFGTADRSVIGTLGHIFASERMWLARLEGASAPAPMTDEQRKLSSLQGEWPGLYARWSEWIAGLGEQAAEREFTYADTKGKIWRNPLWQVVLHVVNHSTHHRGQALGFIRSLGHTPPSLDLMAYYRSQMNA